MRNVPRHNLAGNGVLTDKVRRAAEIIHGVGSPSRVDQIMEDEVAVNALAGLLTRAIESCQAKDGRLDMRDVAAYVLREMKRNQR